jgi:hypothetical protein
MAKQILVPLRKDDRIEEIIPYIKQVAQPGMSVVFLIHHPVNGFKGLQAYCGIMECGLDNTLALRRMEESCSMETRKRLAQQRVFHTCAALQQLGVKIAVELYTGSLRKTLRGYVLSGDVDLIVMRPGFGLGITRLLHGMVSFWGALKRPSIRPVFLLQPGTQL